MEHDEDGDVRRASDFIVDDDVSSGMEQMSDFVFSDMANHDQVYSNVKTDRERNGTKTDTGSGIACKNESQEGELRPVCNWSEVKVGSLAYVRHLGLLHAILVTGKTPERNVVTAVHFAWPCLFRRRVVKEEEFVVDLSKEELFEVCIPEDRRVSPEEAVARARKQIGQKGFNMFTRRSSHVVKECVSKSKTGK